MDNFLQPTYFVKHPDDSYSVADPQPRYIPEPPPTPPLTELETPGDAV